MSATERVTLGRDTSGRPIIMTRRMKAAFDAVVARAGISPVIVQGAFMASVAGGGAAASAGYHDLAGCIDTRTWNLTADQQAALLKVARSVGWAVWKRDRVHGGMDEHMHWVLLDEPNMTAGAAWQENEYRAGRDGLAGQGSDYHWRPEVIQAFDYDAFLEDNMPSMEELKDELVPAIINQLMDRRISAKGMTVAAALRQASSADDMRSILKGLPDAMAQAVEDALPSERESLTRAEVREAARSGAEAALKRLVDRQDPNAILARA